MKEDISKAYNRWIENVLRKALAKRPERKESFETSSGVEVKSVYLPQDIEELDYLRDLGFPGAPPFTRGVQPTMYRGRLWTMRQYAGFGTAEESNKRYRYLISQGQTGLSVAFDLPTQTGYDSDHPLAGGEVGKVGVAIDSLADMETLFSGIDLSKVSTSMTINAPASILLAMYLAVAESRGVSPGVLAGTIQNDILKEYVARGTYIFPPVPSMRLITDTFGFCMERMPRWNAISISGYHIREAGATAAQELAFTLANGTAYIRAALEAGIDIEKLAGRISFFFNAHNNFFEEIAKFRAARRMWTRIMVGQFGVTTPRALRLRFHTQTAGCTLTAQQPENNVVRVTLQALAAVLGGTQSLHTNSKDEALCLPGEEAVKLALRTQQIIAHESGVADTVDPLAGSYFIESLTSRLEEIAGSYIGEIEKIGGVAKAIESGYIQNQIHRSAYAQQKEMEGGEKIIVGVNRFADAETAGCPLTRVDPQTEKAQVKRLGDVRKRRDAKGAEAALDELERCASMDGNLMDPVLRAVKAYCTVGEICDRLRNVFGTYTPPAIL